MPKGSNDGALARHKVLTWFLALVMVLAAATLIAAGSPKAQRWDRQSAATLLAYIDAIETHGLDPADYAPSELQAALNSGDPAKTDQRATLTFGLIARDLATGHLRPAERGGYAIPSDSLDPARVADLIDRALERGDIAGTLDALAPRDGQYAKLRRALARLRPESSRERRRLRVNLERWRWLPRERGPRHLMVNIPEYEARLFDGGMVTASHRVIVGKVATPTPQFRAEIAGVIFNPTWNVPQSIIAESVGKLVRTQPALARARGYTWSFANGGLRVTQQPGPQNALGQMKLDMPNPFSVYMHDTPSRDLFDRDVRTLSHGCLRTQYPLALAASLLTGTEWTRDRIDAAVAKGDTARAALAAPVPVYVVYMTAVADEDGTVRHLDDPYSLDGVIAERLD